MKRDIITRAFRIWLAATGVFVGVNLLGFLLKGRRFFAATIQGAPPSAKALTIASVMLAWLLLGAALFLVANRRFRARHGLPIICTLAVAFLYIGMSRELVRFGDQAEYIKAAGNLAAGEHLHAKYIYPPLLATLLEPLLRLGPRAVVAACWTANILALAAFFWLLAATLRRYGFGHRFSCLLTLAFMTVNVPVMRTLFFGQVNLHVANAILVAILAYPGHPLVSALALAAAVHLKASPIVLAMPFVLSRDRKWTAWFAVSLLAIAGITLAAHGPQPFRDYAHNIGGIYRVNGVNFRESSVDSLARSSFMLMGIPLRRALPAIALLKSALVLFFLAVTAACVKRKTFQAEGPGRAVVNAMPALLLLMLTASPLIWTHHPVLAALAYLVVIKKLDTPGEWLAFGFAYFLEFLLPTFDFFPWSFVRLLSPVMLGALLYQTSSRAGGGAAFLYVENLPGTRKIGREV